MLLCNGQYVASTNKGSFRVSRGGNRDSVLCFIAHETLDHGIKTAFDGLTMAFEGRFTPTVVVMFVGNLHEQPTRKHSEIFDSLNFAHDSKSRRTRMTKDNTRRLPEEESKGEEGEKGTVRK